MSRGGGDNQGNLPMHRVRVEHPLYFIVVAVGFVGGGKGKEPLEHLKATDVVEEGHDGGKPAAQAYQDRPLH